MEVKGDKKGTGQYNDYCILTKTSFVLTKTSYVSLYF